MIKRRYVLGALLLLSCAGTQTGNLAPNTEARLQVGIQAVLNAANGPRILSEGSVLRAGDQVAFDVQTTAEVVLYVVQETSDRKFSMLFPNAKYPQGLAKAGQTTRIPQDWFQVEEGQGERAFYVVASLRPIAAPSILSLVEKRETTKDREPPPGATETNRGRPEPPPIADEKSRGGAGRGEAMALISRTLDQNGIAVLPFRYAVE